MWLRCHTLDAKPQMLCFQVCLQHLNFTLSVWRHITQELVMSRVQNSPQSGNLNLPNILFVINTMVLSIIQTFSTGRGKGFMSSSICSSLIVSGISISRLGFQSTVMVYWGGNEVGIRLPFIPRLPASPAVLGLQVEQGIEINPSCNSI